MMDMKWKNRFFKIFKSLIFFILVPVLGAGFVFAGSAQAQDSATIKTEGTRRVSRVAPGESLPMTVKLMNFGEGERVDVTVHYNVVDPLGRVMIHETETVAVETTASFKRDIPIPPNFPTGQYTAYSQIEYRGQKVPAKSQFQFTVENKFWGLFISDFIQYALITVIVAILALIATRFVVKERRKRFAPHKYSNVKKENRIYYELISDMIMQMRYREGDEAIELAQDIEGLKIEEDTGRVLEINKDPAEIITLLMIQYEKNFGRKKANQISKHMSRKKPQNKDTLNKNLEMINKYFN